jgi:hypothetical protein
MHRSAFSAAALYLEPSRNEGCSKKNNTEADTSMLLGILYFPWSREMMGMCEMMVFEEVPSVFGRYGLSTVN